MFRSATLKLTIWYASILIAISLVFSVIIYSIASTELGTRIETLQQSARPFFLSNQSRYDIIRDAQVREAEANLIVSLIVTNMIIWVAGIVGSYYLALQTLRPIQESHDAQSRFTSDASHELSTPLASMKTELEVALRDPDISKQEMHELLESNLEEVNKLASLSQTLLQLSRLDHDKIVREKVALDTVTKSVITRFSKVTSRIRLDHTNKVHVRANKANVEQLLTILLDNALKYSPDTSVVHVTLVRQRNMAGFEVANEGDGIPADKLPSIFDRFYQIESSRTSSDRKGLGLGLSLAKKLVQLHGGELTVSSAPGEKTTFRVLLPIFSKETVKNQ